MKKTNFLTIAVATLILLLGANLATALDPIPKESGLRQKNRMTTTTGSTAPSITKIPGTGVCLAVTR